MELNKWAESLPNPEGYLKESQIKSRNHLKENGLPTKEIEAWRLTNPRKLKKIFDFPVSTSKKLPLGHKNLSKEIDQLEGNVHIILDSLKEDPIENLDLPKGVRALTSEEIKLNLGDIIYNNSDIEKSSIIINEASNTQLLALKVEGRDLVNIKINIKSGNGVFSSSRVLLIVEDYSNLNLVYNIEGVQDSALSHISEIKLGKQSICNHGVIAFGDNNSSLLSNFIVSQESESSYSFTAIQSEWELSRIEPKIIQASGNAKTNLKGLQVSKQNQEISTHSYVKFKGPEGSLEQLQKAAAIDNSHCIFNGAIKVPQVAQKTNASQLSRNLLMSNRARIDTKPELEIIADDVRCAHGATVSQLQEEELFYLRSRGITSKEASSLLLKGYCKEIIDSLPNNQKDIDVLDRILESIKK